MMTIDKLHITAFGKLRDIDIDLNGKVNLFVQNNGYGKSTIAAFIKAMLYGFNYTTRVKVNENDIKRYKPWGSTTKFGGSMVVTYEGQTYQVSRQFYKTARDEELTIINANNGVDASQVFIQGVGQTLLGLDMFAYERCIYIPQEDIEIKNDDSFVNKLSKIVQGGDEATFDQAHKKLVDARRNYKLERGNGGYIYETDEKIAALQQTIEQTKKEYVKVDDNLIKIAEQNKALTTINLEISNTKLQIAEMQQAKDNKFKVEQFEMLNKASREIGQALAEQKAVLGNRQYSDEKLEEIAVSVGELQEVNALNQLQSQRLQEVEQQSEVKVNKPILVLTCISFTICIMCLVMATVVEGAQGLYAVVIAMAVAGVVGLGFSLKNYIDTKVGIFSKRGGYNLQAKETYKARLLESTQQQQLLINKLKEDIAEIDTTDDAIKIAQKYASFCSNCSSCRRLTKQYDDANERLNSFVQTTTIDMENIIEFDSDRFDSINARHQTLLNDYNDRDKEVVRMTEENKNIVAKLNDLSWLQASLQQLNEQKRQYKHNFDSLELAIKCLTEAKDILSTSYVPQMKQELSSRIGYITDGQWNKAEVNNEFALKLYEKGESYDIAYFSKGIQEICLFSLRLSLIKLLYGNNAPLLILDDPFVNFDESKFDKATELLKEFSVDTQVIYLSCHERSKRLIDNR